MRTNTKSSITLPRQELLLVKKLKARLHMKTNVQVVRAGLHLLTEETDRRALKEAYRQASAATRQSVRAELDELDHLSGEAIR
jgi:hypothetical protein